MDEIEGKSLVSIIIVTWNSEPFIKNAVDSALAQTYKPIEIIVIDNSSADGTLKLLRRLYSKNRIIRIIENKFNIGFAAANNQGLYIANGEYIFFLNPDTKLDKKFLSYALKAFDDPTIGAVSGKIIRFDRKTIDSAGQTLGRNRRPIEKGYGKPDCPAYSLEKDCFSVCGAAALFRKKAVQHLSINGQFFDESYSSFYEDLDAGWRLNLFGWRCRYVPRAVVYHHRGGSKDERSGITGRYQISGRSSAVQADIIRNRWYTIVKNDHFINFILHFPWIFTRDLLTIGYLLVFRRDAIARVFKRFFKNLPVMLEKRKIIKKKRTARAKDIRKRMKL